MQQLRQYFSRWNSPSKFWGLFLIFLIISQIGVTSYLGVDGRDAIKHRIEKTNATLAASGTVFESSESRDAYVFRSIRTREFVATGLFYGAATGIAISTLLLLTLFWWGKDISISGHPPPRRFSRHVVFAIIGISLIGMAVRLPRMNLSLYNDESFNFTRYIHGQFKPDKITGEMKFHQLDWQTTIWGNKFGNNGELYSILARICYDTWSFLAGAVDGEVNETALRMPSLIAGSLSVAGIGLLGLITFGPRTALIASTIAAFHPWHLRYCTEARPYGLVLFFSIAILLFLIFAIREGRWRWWIGFSLSQALLLFSNVSTLYFLIAVNLTAGIWIFTKNRQLLKRWIVANLLGALLFIQIIAPSIPQIASALSQHSIFKGETGVREVLEMISYLTSGMPFKSYATDTPWSAAWKKLGPWGIAGFTLAVTIAAAGVLNAFKTRGNRAGKFIVTAGIFAVALAVIGSNVTHAVLLHWYVIYALPAFIFIIALGIDFFWSRRKIRILGPVFTVFFLGVFAFPFASNLTHSKEPLRSLVEHVRGSTYPFDGESSRPLIAAFWSDTVYDPTIHYTPTLEELKKVIQKAREENRPLFVEFGHRSLALKTTREVVDYLEKSGEFVFVKTFYGMEQNQFSHHLYSLKTASAKAP